MARTATRWLGIVLAAAVLLEILTFALVDPQTLSDGLYVSGMLAMLPFLAGLLYAPYWLERSDVSSTRYPRIASWWLGGLVAFTLVNAILIQATPAEPWPIVVGWLRWAVVIGASVGLLIGTIEARAIERARRAERHAVRAEQLEKQRDLLDYLNSILRHEVLNTAAIVDGYATRLLDDGETLDADEQEWARVIHEEADDLTTVIDDVRVLLRTASGDHELHPVELTSILRDEVASLERATDATVETDLPPSAYVRGDSLVARVFGNILGNAVEHNDDPEPWVGLSATVDGETVRVDIEDNGPGVSSDKRGEIFDRERGHTNTHGLGLYLVEKLVSAYGGEVRLAETGPDGSRFTVELPTVPAPDDQTRTESPGPAQTGPESTEPTPN
ncbi:integral membrane sensor signal transduction histidine kinase [Halovivax asiaticus JCM 14624]|uniref:histidine kinase n=1 Tax=Halovivax asiaticus JCM 14624 TaxID=1227490 RepID=M0BJY5_9EURY|nr:ATP-binding protein [Halovivax asiaticus]ELZ09944.1 integral membrane sensor signal transduction histidine kinase [Halovivax asiaticus JCM 14624]